MAIRLLREGFTNRDLRETVAPLMGLVAEYHRNRTNYDPRRPRFRRLVERILHNRHHRVTEDGVRTALRYQRTHARVKKPVNRGQLRSGSAP